MSTKPASKKTATKKEVVKPVEVPKVVEPPKPVEVQEVPKPVEKKKRVNKKVADPAPVEVPAPVPAPVVAPVAVPVEPAKEEKKEEKKKAKKPKKGGKKKAKKDKKTKAKKAKTTEKPIMLSEVKRARYFKIVFEGLPAGRFSGSKPRQAASKALTSIIRKKLNNDFINRVNNKLETPKIGQAQIKKRTAAAKKYAFLGTYEENKDIIFQLKECTRWNPKKCNKNKKAKVYTYVGKRVPLPEDIKKKMAEKPIVHNKDDPNKANHKPIEYKYHNIVHKYKQPEEEKAK
jgi:hypothetical protein